MSSEGLYQVILCWNDSLNAGRLCRMGYWLNTTRHLHDLSAVRNAAISYDVWLQILML